LTLTFNFTGTSGLFISPYWSLPVEFQYYLLLPFVILMMKFIWSGFLSPILVSVILYAFYKFNVISIDRTEVFQLGFVFFGGVLVARCHQVVSFKMPALLTLFFFVLMSLFLGMIKNDILTIPGSIPFLSTKWNLFGVFAVFSVALCLITKPIKSEGYFSSVIHNYGTILYSIYLSHMIFLGVASLIVIHSMVLTGILKLWFIFTLVGSYYFPNYSYKYIEVPFVNFGRKMARYFS